MTTLRITDEVRGQASKISASLGVGERLALSTGGRATALPDGLADTISRLLSVLAEGGAVTVTTMPRELTTTETARQLGVSRPTVMKWITDGSLRAHKVGTHHRVLFTDAAEFASRRHATQMQAFERLRESDDVLGINN